MFGHVWRLGTSNVIFSHNPGNGIMKIVHKSTRSHQSTLFLDCKFSLHIQNTPNTWGWVMWFFPQSPKIHRILRNLHIWKNAHKVPIDTSKLLSLDPPCFSQPFQTHQVFGGVCRLGTSNMTFSHNPKMELWIVISLLCFFGHHKLFSQSKHLNGLGQATEISGLLIETSKWELRVQT